jgi:hypothetical protein
MIAPVVLSRSINYLHVSRLVLWSGIALSALLTLALSTNAQSIVFGTGVNYQAGDGPWGLVTGDFNGDGRPDIAVANHSGPTPGTFANGVNVLIAKADGTFQSAVNYPGGIGPTHLLSADLNLDGKLDLATANSESKSLSVLLGNGNGTFQSAVNYSLSDRPDSVIAADFNRDGFPDLAASIRGNTISVLIGSGNGSFGSPVSFQVAGGPQALVAGDFNRDGKLDILSTSGPTRAVSVLLGNGDGTFHAAINSSTGGNSEPSSVVLGDFNRDDKIDLGVASLSPPSLNIMLGNGDGTFALPSYQTASINTPADLAAGDFNGDGKLDLVSSGVFIGPDASVFLGNGNGTLQPAVEFGMGPGAIAVSVADFNSDTRPDLALVANGEVSVVLINATPGNPDHSDYFVHQQYLDFLSREPDVFGFDYWKQQIDQCGNNPSCILDRRIGVSAAFIVESEFQQSGYFVYRIYKASFGRRPTYLEFTTDSKKVIGGSQLDESKNTLINAFAQTGAFKAVYPDNLSNTDFVNKLFDAAALTPFTAERQAALDALNHGASRASVLRSVVENPTFTQREYNPAFVQMQYFGYLRRDEEAVGYDFWLDVMSQQPNNYRRMVCAFITSGEYQLRFSNNVTHSNFECGP